MTLSLQGSAPPPGAGWLAFSGSGPLGADALEQHGSGFVGRILGDEWAGEGAEK